VRIAGWQVPPGYLRWAAAGFGLLLLSVALAMMVNLLGLFGFAAAEDAGTRVSAKVATGAPCNVPNATEVVTFSYEKKDDRQARLDGCGHEKGEVVDILVPPGPVVDSMVVHAAGAAVGDSGPGRGVGLVLLILSGLAGSVFAFLVRRGPRTRALPMALRLAGEVPRYPPSRMPVQRTHT
jgi:hypothetical protein